jgi:hypothetical protein
LFAGEEIEYGGSPEMETGRRRETEDAEDGRERKL